MLARLFFKIKVIFKIEKLFPWPLEKITDRNRVKTNEVVSKQKKQNIHLLRIFYDIPKEFELTDPAVLVFYFWEHQLHLDKLFVDIVNEICNDL